MPELTQLYNTFGFSNFRPGQRDIVDAINQGRDVFAIMHTGSGKSLCFQLPALMQEGLCIVITPLISLMHDQIVQLQAIGVSAKALHSDIEMSEQQQIMTEAYHNQLKLLYISPERLLSETFTRLLHQVRISFIVIDEAHVLHDWGEAFRPGYVNAMTRLREIEKYISERDGCAFKFQKCAFSASVVEDVRRHIVRCVPLHEPRFFIHSMDRPAITLNVMKVKPGKDEKLFVLLDLLEKHKYEPTLIYCTSRRDVDTLYRRLRLNRYKVEAYHAGMSKDDRARNQQAFTNDELDIMVCTKAFGMGVDKANIRVVIHHKPPSCLEDLYQEFGRAGRDKQSAVHYALFQDYDFSVLRKRLDAQHPSPESYQALREFWLRYASETGNEPMPVDPKTLPDLIKNGVTCHNIQTILDEFVRSGFLHRQTMISTQNGKDCFDTLYCIAHQDATIDTERLTQRAEQFTKRLHAVESYFYATACRRYMLLEYLGEPNLPAEPQQCGNCDVCLDHSPVKIKTSILRPTRDRLTGSQHWLTEKLHQLKAQKAKVLHVSAHLILSDVHIIEIVNTLPDDIYSLSYIGLSSTQLQHLGLDILSLVEKAKSRTVLSQVITL